MLLGISPELIFFFGGNFLEDVIRNILQTEGVIRNILQPSLA